MQCRVSIIQELLILSSVFQGTYPQSIQGSQLTSKSRSAVSGSLHVEVGMASARADGRPGGQTAGWPAGVKQVKLKNQKMKILKIQIRSAQNAGKVWISRKNNLPAPFGAIPGHFLHGPKKTKKKCQKSHISRGGPRSSQVNLFEACLH